MKRTKRTCLTRILVLVLVVAMLTPTTLAAGSGFGLSSWFQGIWDRFVGWFQPVQPEVPEEPEVPAAELTVVESPDTVDNGDALRASTYALGDTAAPLADGTTKYFPVTLFDYEADEINAVTHAMEYEANPYLDEWSGLYFNDGNPQPIAYTYSQNGGYVAAATLEYSRYGYATYENSGYYYPDGNGHFYEVTDIECQRTQHGWGWWTYYTYEWTIRCGNRTFSSEEDTITLYRSAPAETDELPFADYNKWTGNINDNPGAPWSGAQPKGNRVYSGMVETELNNGDIQFTMTEPGIFTTTPVEGKEVYTNVELPFEYDSTNQMYSFNSDEFGAYIANGQEMASGVRLQYSANPQRVYNGDQQVTFGDGSENVWLPFNSGTRVSQSSANYHFGMKAVIPFTMTEDGKLMGENGEDIVFEFSGDDDVWVFIDGTLVLDIGGIHNRLGGRLNFADNTWELFRPDSNTVTYNAGSDRWPNWQPVPVGDVKDAALTGALFNDGETQGLLNQTRASFAAQDEHQLTIFYLERGESSSNCQITFNLPVKDSVSVTKQVSTTDSENIALDEEALTAAQSRNFTFTLYKDGVAVANRNYSLLNSTGTYVATRSTDSNGKFTLRHGETAKFVGEISSTNPGNSYYVVEDVPAGWVTPDFTESATGANDAEISDDTLPSGTSQTVTMQGGIESEDSITFVCTNTLKHVDGTSLTPANDTIVIDYGLPVEVDVLANDIVTGGTKSLEKVTGGIYGTAEITREGKIRYTLNQPLTGIETLTYTVKATSSSGVVADNKEATATLTIIPATVMYYEENFANMVEYSGGWTPTDGEPDGELQETGIVGTSNDSPYGSDVAYLNDNGDSNGTSMYLDAESNNGGVFTYTFTGTGTSFFARTSNNTGWLQVKVYEGTEINDQNVIDIFYEDTRYMDDSNPNAVLYNIPVITWDAVDVDYGYGTYTVRVSVNNNKSGKYGGEFWLDGIRVFNPLNPDALPDDADSAYNADGEANMDIATLRDKLLVNSTSVDPETGDVIWDGENFVLFTDTNDRIVTADEYESNGPKEEVYLAKDQSVTFSLRNWDPNANRVWLGIKAPMGGGTVTINNIERQITNTTDCFYELTQGDISYEEDGTAVITFRIKCTGDTVISLTNVKVSGSAEFTVIDNQNTPGEDGVAEP